MENGVRVQKTPYDTHALDTQAGDVESKTSQEDFGNWTITFSGDIDNGGTFTLPELMPALKSAWFGTHIGSAALSYAAFALAALMGIRYLIVEKKAEEKHLKQLDNLSYKMICFGFFMLSVVIFSGCIWAEQAWSTFWSWDPKETWALITWIVYAFFLHQRLRMKWQGKRMAILSIAAFIFVMFTFVGVNTLMSGLHSYA